MKAFRHYLAITASKRREGSHIFLKLANAEEIKKETISGICLRAMKEAGIDTDKYKSHSLRMASANNFLNEGMTPEEVMKLGDWNSVEVFQRFYYRPKATGVPERMNAIAHKDNGSRGRTRGRKH
jgi:site-specific recombinase XerD